MKIIEGKDQVRWLVEGSDDNMMSVGVEVDSYAARAELLHAMWEDPSQSGAPTYDQLEKSAIAAGRIQPRVVGDINLSEMTTMTGMVGGLSAKPHGWKRLRWAELADRWEVPLDLAEEVNPLIAFQPGLTAGSWPSSIRPPTEGSLDWETYERLLAILRAFTVSSPILVYSTFLSWFGDTGLEIPLVTATMDELLASHTTSPISGSGQNWWPIDREWLVYTDYDLSSTVVHGDEELVRAVVADEFFEVVRPNPTR